MSDPESIDRGIAEFGALLAGYVADHPGCLGAVLTDDDGYPIDHARRRAAVSPLDLQIAGAQLEHLLCGLRARGGPLSASPLGVAFRGARGLVLATTIGQDYALVALHRRMDAIHGVEADFDALTRALADLLGA